MTFSRRLVAVTEAVAVAVVMAVAELMPGCGAVEEVVAYLALLVIGLCAYRLSPYRSWAGAFVLIVAWTLLGVGAIANLHLFTGVEGASPQYPMLINKDSAVYFDRAIDYMSDGSGYWHKPYHVVFGWLVTAAGGTPLLLVAVNSLAVILVIVLSGFIAGSFVATKRIAVSTTAMALMTAMCYLVAIGTVILKDALVCLGMALFVASLAPLQSRGAGKCRVLALLVMGLSGAALVAVMRSQYLALCVVAVVVCLFSGSKLRWRYAVALLVIIGVVTIVHEQLATFNGGHYRPAMMMLDTQTVSEDYVQPDLDHGAYSGFAADYISGYPFWLKILCLPIVCAVQFFIPLPWTALRDLDFGYTMVYAHFGFPWYAMGGMVIYFLVFCLRKAPRGLVALTVTGCLLWATPAFLVAGLVSRYALPMLPMLVPAAAWVWVENRHSVSFRRFSVAYVLVLTGSLVAIYCLQYS